MNTDIYYAVNLINTFLHTKCFFIVHRLYLVQDGSKYIYYFHRLGYNNKKKFLKLKWILNYNYTYQHYHISNTELSANDIINIASGISFNSKYMLDVRWKIWIINK